MSNEVYGYIEAPNKLVNAAFFEGIENSTGIGIKQIPISELYNFPKEKLPRIQSECFAFIIGDHPGKSDASYLTDYMDYAPEADIGLPNNGKERLALLVDLLTNLIHDSKPRRFVVAITECSQIDQIKNINSQYLGAEIYRDFECHDAPPDCVYDATVE